MPTWLSIPVYQAFVPALLVLSLLVAVECVLYFLKVPFYFRMGPTLAREQWQTAASAREAWTALRAALPHCKFSARDGGDILCFRRAWWAWSAFPRVTLRVADDSDRSVIVYEVKPFLSMAPFAALFLLLVMAGIAAFMSMFVVISVVLAYWLLWRSELRTFRRLACMRTHLRSIGVLVCSECGYDLFGRLEHQACPECGRTPASPALTTADRSTAPRS